MRVFSETQKFNHWWMQLINLGMIAFLLYCLYMWFVAKESVGNVAPTDNTGRIVVIATIIPIIVLLYFAKLTTSIDEIGVHYKFPPFLFSKKTIAWTDMEQCYVRTYSPIREYGGWGYRSSFGRNGKAYNIKGNKGIQIELETGKKLLIGTQKENDAQRVIDRYFKKLL